jgi:hypothetical protein
MHYKTATCFELIDHHQGVLHMMSYVLVISNTYLDYTNIKINYKVVAPLLISTTISERLTSSPTYLYQKDKRPLPWYLHSRKFTYLSPLHDLSVGSPWRFYD